MSGKGWPKWAIAVLLAILTISSIPVLAQEAEGWAISPGEARVDGILLGESANIPITLINNESSPLTFTMSAEIPPADELRPGYEVIPDTNWITFNLPLVELEANSRQDVIVTVAIPPSGDWRGRNYECWLRATSEAMGMLRVELDCRLLLSTSAGYARGIDGMLAGIIAGVVVVIGAMAYSNRRTLKKWAGRW